MAEPLLDLQISPPVVEPPLSRLFRYVFGTLVLGIFCLLALFGTNELATSAVESQAAQVRRAIAEEQTRMAARNSEIQAITRNRQRAEDIGQWLRVSLSVQPVLAAALEDLPEELTVRNFALQLAEGQSQISNLEVTLLGDGRLINRQIDLMTQRFQNAGLQLVSPDPGAVDGGIRFRGRFLFLPPDQIRW
jgi:hypothetical protein